MKTIILFILMIPVYYYDWCDRAPIGIDHNLLKDYRNGKK